MALVAVSAAVYVRSMRASEERSDKFAAIRFSPLPGQPGANKQRLAGLLTDAARRGARYIVLPELSLTGPLSGFDGRKKIDRDEYAESIPGPSTEFFAAYAKRLKVWLVFSMAEKAGTSGGHYVTTVLLDDDGRVLYKFRKITPRINGEDGAGMVRGDPRTLPESIDDSGRRIGILSGDDVQAGVPRLASRGADTILITAGWGAEEPVNWREVCRDLSRRYRVNLVVANRAAPPSQNTNAKSEASAILKSGETVQEQSGAGESENILIASLAMPSPSLTVPTSLGLPSVPFPTYLPPAPETVELGRQIFFDKRLSSDGLVSCSTCHQPDKAFASGGRFAVGVKGRKAHRNVPSLLNVAFKEHLFWDGSSASLELQSKFPMSHVSEMNSHYLEIVKYVRSDPEYAEQFRGIKKNGEVEFDDVAGALASYQRTLISGNSAFDRFQYGGDVGALDADAKRGLQLFTGKAGCAACHLIGEKSALLMDQQFHNTGVGYKKAFSDLGLGGVSDGSKSGFFLTPSLRNVAETAPYMHDGSLGTLEEVVEFYNKGGVPNPQHDPLLRPLNLSREERQSIVAFLRSLTGVERYSANGRRLEATTSAGASGRDRTAVFAAIQFTPHPGSVERNHTELKRLIRHAAGRGGRFIVLPEHALTGPLSELNLAPEQYQQFAALTWEQSRRIYGGLARELGAWIVLSSPEYDAEKNRLHLATRLFNDLGQVAGYYRKLSPKRERGDGYVSAGDFRSLRSIQTPFGRLGILAGDDITRGVPRLAQLGARTILISASWQPSDVTRWDEDCAELARRYGVNLIVSNLRDPRPENQLPGKWFTYSAGSGATPGGASADGDIVYTSLWHPSHPAEQAAPLGLPPPPQPPFNPLTRESVELGQKIFFDKRLSRDGTVSCATCHVPGTAFADHERVAKGVSNRLGKKNVPSLLNTAYRVFLGWEGHAASPEEQLKNALHSWAEMDTSADEMVDYIRRQDDYREKFRRVTGRDDITFDDVAMTTANYLRTLLSGHSPFDRYYFGGDEKAISAKAKRGLDIFMNKGNCVSCHVINDGYALFTDDAFHNTGVGYHRRFDYLGYMGDGLESNPATKNQFRGEYVTPTLRNIAMTAPYMHDGSLATLEDVVRFYNRGGNPNPFIDRAIKPRKLTKREQEDLVEFLRTLTSVRDDRTTLAQSR